MARPTFTPELARKAAQRSIQVRREKARAALADLTPPALEPTLDGLVRHGKWVLDQLGRGRMDPKVASSMTYGLQQRVHRKLRPVRPRPAVRRGPGQARGAVPQGRMEPVQPVARPGDDRLQSGS